ncbi:MAG TPA: hypothetical protein VFV02_14325 [Acidimicrobiales bacterium]|nr:hypothetical protein [Acidimicrobiales bacterium]
MRAKASVATLPNAGELHTIADQLQQAIAQGNPEVVKQFLGELVDRIGIGSDKQAQPYFRVPRLQELDPLRPGAAGQRGSYAVKPRGVVSPDTNRHRSMFPGPVLELDRELRTPSPVEELPSPTSLPFPRLSHSFPSRSRLSSSPLRQAR